MNQNFTKDTIIKLLSGMSSEKEIRKYLDRFSSDDFRFAVIKVGGAVIENDLENLISSLVFLNEVGLRPIARTRRPSSSLRKDVYCACEFQEGH